MTETMSGEITTECSCGGCIYQPTSASNPGWKVKLGSRRYVLLHRKAADGRGVRFCPFCGDCIGIANDKPFVWEQPNVLRVESPAVIVNQGGQR